MKHSVCARVVELQLFLAGRQTNPRETDFGPERDDTHRHPALGISCHAAGRAVGIAIDAEALAGSNRKKPQQVTTGQRGNESLFRIDRGRIGPGERHDMWRRRCGDLGAAVKAQQVPAAVTVIEKVLPVANPDEVGGIFSHGQSPEKAWLIGYCDRQHTRQ
jgi:hypothetical protein